MFETATLTYGAGSKRVWGTFAGITGQAMLVTCAVIAPMISPAVLPRAAWLTSIEAPGPPPPPPLPPGPQIRPKTTTPIASQVVDGGVVTPTWIPPQAIILEDPPETVGRPGIPGGIAGGDKDGLIGGVVSTIAAVRPPAPVVHAVEPAVVTPPPTPAAIVKPPRISAIELAHPIRRVEPVYPPLARQARVSGVVELQGVLGTDGRIHELKVLHGHPLLVKAAVDAVLQWTYAPTMLNGQPVEVVAPIIVTFTLH